MRRYWSMGWLLCALVVMAAPIVSRAQLLVITVAPPELPVYEQPAIPDPGYIWTPGYWAYGPEGYYWVPGTWVEPPSVGLLWTPGYWGWQDGNYGWNDGYWGTQVGFYGGVDYGYGYGGAGYEGGYWDNGVFSYNETVNNFGGVRMAHVYSKAIVAHNNASRASFNGGAGGTSARPTAQEQAAAHEKHVAPTALQTQHQHAASTNKALLASVNHGSPAIAATSKPGQFEGKGVVPAKAGGGTVPAALAKPNATPVGAAPAGAAPAGAAALEKNRPVGNAHPATNAVTAPKSTTGVPPKPLATGAPPKAVTPPKAAVVKPPPAPRTAAVVRPPPHPAAVRPPAPPHPVAARPPPPRPAPKPPAAKPPPPKKPPPH
jgi:YXWGXW repeat-containing protein